MPGILPNCIRYDDSTSEKRCAKTSPKRYGERASLPESPCLGALLRDIARLPNSKSRIPVDGHNGLNKCWRNPHNLKSLFNGSKRDEIECFAPVEEESM